MSDPFDNLSALGDGEPLALAPAAAVRARGEQRRRTIRTTVGLTGAAVLLAAGAAFGLGQTGGTPDSLAPVATPEPSASPTVDTTSPSDVADQLRRALFNADDADTARSGTWTVVDLPLPAVPITCTVGASAERVDGEAHRTLQHRDGQRLFHQVIVYADESGASASMEDRRRKVRDCSSSPLASSGATGTRYMGFAAEPGSHGPDAIFVESSTSCGPEKACPSRRVRYAALRIQRAVVVLELDYLEEDPISSAEQHALAEQLAELAHRAGQRVNCAFANDCRLEPYVASRLPRPAILTHGGTTWVVILAASKDKSDSRLAAAASASRALGYLGTDPYGPYTCADPGPEGFGFERQDDVYVSELHFATPADADRFVAAYEPPVVKIVKTISYCLD